jgi:hypothetical protein
MRKRYGLVCKISNVCFLAEYDDQGRIGTGYQITDPRGDYKDLTPNELSFVEIVMEPQEDVVYLRDLRKIDITHEDDPSKTVHDFIKTGGMVDLARTFYAEITGASDEQDGCADRLGKSRRIPRQGEA